MLTAQAKSSDKALAKQTRASVAGYDFCVNDSLSERTGWDAKFLCEFIATWLEQNSGEHLAAGRGALYRIPLPGGLTVIVRKYYRGGLMRHFVREGFFQIPGTPFEKLRPVEEFVALEKLRGANVAVPAPLLAAVSAPRTLFYRGLIATVEIANVDNLLALVKKSAVSGDKLRRIGYLAGREMNRALQAGVYHPDFHLGNVLVEAALEKIWLIDFDRCRLLQSVSEQAAHKHLLLLRWEKSTSKHGLTAELDSAFKEGLYEAAA